MCIYAVSIVRLLLRKSITHRFRERIPNVNAKIPAPQT